MPQAGLSGSFTISGNGTYTVEFARLPVVGTITIQFTSAAWGAAGQIVPKLRLATRTGAYVNTTYQKPGSATDIAAGTAVTGSDLIYVRLDGTELALDVSAYASGTMLVEWQWSAG